MWRFYYEIFFYLYENKEVVILFWPFLYVGVNEVMNIGNTKFGRGVYFFIDFVLTNWVFWNTFVIIL